MKPLHAGPGGRSYRCVTAGDLDLGTYLVQVPADKPHHQQWFAVMGADLRAADDVAAPHLSYDGARFEVSIWALSATANTLLREMVAQPEIDTRELALPLVFPGIVLVQFHGVPDKSARAVIEAVAAAICTGRIEPKRTFSEAWRRAITATVEHFQGGHDGTADGIRGE